MNAAKFALKKVIAKRAAGSQWELLMLLSPRTL
jgi:hypothetical protein